MREFSICHAIVGSVTVIIHAENEADALAQFKEGEWLEAEVTEWDFARCRGNVCNALSYGQGPEIHDDGEV